MNDFLDRHKNYLKYLLLLSLITFVIFFIASAAHGAWYTDWNYRKKITIQSSRVSGGPHTNFPVLIKLTSDTELAADAQETGDDILFTTADGETKIPHEIESFNGSTGALVAWVRVDSISSSGNTVIYMYYGNGSAGNQENASQVWSNNFQGVWHLEEPVTNNSSASDAHQDSTSNNNHGNQINNNDLSAKIAEGQDFEGDARDEYVEIPNSSSLENVQEGNYTVEAWFYSDTTPPGTGDAWNASYSIVMKRGWHVGIYMDQYRQIAMAHWLTGDVQKWAGSGTKNNTTWYHVAGVVSKTAGYTKIYVNGVNEDTDYFTANTAAKEYGTTTWRIGIANTNRTSWGWPANGKIDEARISSVARSADWIKTSYNNQVWPNTANTPSPTPSPNPGGGFITVDPYESGGGGGNQQPVADAGTNQNVITGATVALDGSGSSDPDDDDLTFSWSFVDKPGGSTATLSDPTAVNPTFTADVSGTYELQLIVNDGTVNSDADSVFIYAGTLDLSGYSCNMKITIQGSKVQGGPHADFPVLISLTDESLKASGCGFVTSDDGYDILFTNSTKSIQLDHEIETYDKDAGELLAWVKVDVNANPSNTDIYMYYGKSGAGDQQNPTGVWSNNYRGVWHLNETVSDEATTGTHYDSTANNNHGAQRRNNDATGKIFNGQYFDGNSDYIEVQDAGSLDVTTELTMEVWVNLTSAGTNQKIVGKTNAPSYTRGYLTGVQTGLYPEIWNSQGTNRTFTSGSISSSQWTHLATTWKTGGNMIGYINGSQVNSISAGSYNIGTTAGALIIGAAPWNPDTFRVTGIIDEVRISGTARSADWIKTEYNNQNDPASFYNWEKQCPDSTPPISEFACSIPITIDSSKVSGTSDLVDFPVLISLTNISLKSTANCGYVQSTNGYDIIFSDAAQTTRLDHEIEKYDSASGELVAWVRIPTLSVENDTTIYVHFGHSSVCGTLENAAGVWDSNYAGVWHLKETDIDGGSGDIKDSTSPQYNGTTSGMNSSDQVEGLIGGSFDFDGRNDYIDLPTIPDSATATVECWFQYDTYGYSEALISKGTWSAGDVHFKVHNSSPTPHVEARPYTGGTPDSGTLSAAPSWYHVAYTYNKGGNIILYVNGSPVDSDSASSNDWSGSNIEIGHEYTDYSDYTRFFDGRIDEARISKVARTSDWIQTEYNNQSDPASFYSVGASSCFLGGFSCNRKITIPGDNVSGSGDLTDFPVLIKIENDCNLKTSANGGHIQDSNGYDILFTDASGATQFDHEIEDYDGVKGDLTAWVKVPTLYGSSDTDIYMYYGKSSLTCDPANAAGVWDGNYKGVWHLKENPTDTAPQMRDSTANGNHGTNRNMTSGDQVAGKIGGSLDFDGYNDYVSTANSFNNPQNFTVSAWFKTGSASGKRVVGFENTQTGTASTSWDRTMYVGTNGKVYFGAFDGTTDVAESTDTLNDNSWHYAVGVRDDGADYVRLYIDGSLNNSTYNNYAENYTGWWRIGSYKNSDWPYGQDGYFPGLIDEVRLSNTVRSADWIKTEYDNQRDPASFISMGNDSCGGQYGFNYQYCKKITVDHTQVDSDLTNFPLLVNITGDDDLKTVANGGRVYHSLGYDIAFYSPSCGQLDHEIEKYDGSADAGTLIAWVKVPTLSASTDTEIYMYYGDSSVTCSPENPPAVWDSNYKAVWHLHDDLEDSTSNNNDGTGNGTSNDTGKIADAESFDGSDDYISVGDNASLDVTSGLTMEAWVRLSNAGNNQKIVGKVNSTYTRGYLIGVDGGLYPEIWNNQGTNHVFTSGSISSSQWAHLATTWTTGGNMIGYINGSQVNSISAGSYDIGTNSDALIIGAAPWNPSTFEVNGRIDEVRVSAIARSADWIMAEYKNQNDPGNFYTIGSCFEQTTKMTEGWEEDF